MKPAISVFLASQLLAALGHAADGAGPQVSVTDSGLSFVTIAPGAPAHTVGLQGQRQTIVLDTGTRAFGLRYLAALDPKNPRAAIPGEGYIGMPEPVSCNWYGSGFFDLSINGQSIGATLIHSLTGRRSGGNGVADFVFDTAEAAVRVRFAARPGDDCLFAQALIDPKAAVNSLRLTVRCYPSAFVSDAERHVLTPVRDLAQGQRAELDLARETWTLYYDRIYDEGYATPGRQGVGPCGMLWLPEQVEKAGFTVGNYGIETSFELKPWLRDFRFLFFDYSGKKNEAAKIDLRGRAVRTGEELAAFPFADPGLVNWPLEGKLEEIRRALAAFPEEREMAARYEAWAGELAELLPVVRAGSSGAVMAGGRAAQIIGQWEQGLPALQLKALLHEI